MRSTKELRFRTDIILATTGVFMSSRIDQLEYTVMIGITRFSSQAGTQSTQSIAEHRG